MIDQKVIEYAIQQGGLVLVCVFALWQLSKLQARYDALLSRVLESFEKNTVAITSLTEATNHVGDVVSACGINRRHGEK